MAQCFKSGNRNLPHAHLWRAPGWPAHVTIDYLVPSAQNEPMRRANGRRVKIHLSYSIEETARCVCVHKNTVRRWLSSGLSAIDARRPALIHGSKLRAFLELLADVVDNAAARPALHHVRPTRQIRVCQSSVRAAHVASTRRTHAKR